jgi:hypothetical protein
MGAGGKLIKKSKLHKPELSSQSPESVVEEGVAFA